LPPDTDYTMRLESAGDRPDARHLACRREELPRPAAVGSTKLTGRTLRQRRPAPDTGTGLMAGSMSTGSHDGDSPGPARPWDR